MKMRIFRSAMSLMLCVAMLLGLAQIAVAEPAVEATESPVAEAIEATSMAVGDVINGFEVTETGEFAMINADTVLLEHQKTGAKVLFLLNEDTNRSFDITFKTPLDNDKGIPHVFEHSTLNGSEKYPSTSLFFNLSYQTYNTYMNAATYEMMTSYPVASLSEAQLLKYADFYLDSCFNPMLMTDESIFESEAWRYSLDSADDDLTIAGTVYSEMQGAASLSSSAYRNAMKAAFPGSHIGYNQGGEPSEIPSMTWEEVKEYHETYYHPSNSLTIIYGDIEDPASFLSLLDTVFSEYDAKEFDLTAANYTPVTEPTDVVCQYPVYEGTETENAAETYVTFICENATDEEKDVLDLLTSLLTDSSSPLINNMIEKLPNVSISAYTIGNAPEYAVTFNASGMNESDVETLKSVIYDSILEFAENGVSQDVLDSIAASLKMETALMSENSSNGVNMSSNIAYYWVCTDDVNSYAHFIDNFDNFAKFQEEGKYNEVIAKYLTKDNARVITVTTVPAPGLKEQEEAELAEELAEKKAAMTEDEINAIVEQTAALAAGNTDDASEYVAQLQAVTVDSLPEEVRIYDYRDLTDSNGIRHIDVVADVDGIGKTYMLLDASAVPQEDLFWFNLYANLVGSVNTTEHDWATLSSLESRYLYGATVKAAVLNADNELGYNLYLRASWTALDEDMANSYDLLYEVLFENDYTDTALMSSLIASMKQSIKDSYDSSIYAVQLYRAMSQGDPAYNLYNYITGIDYYHFLDEAEALLESDPAAFAEKLNHIQTLLCNSTNSIYGVAGNADTIETHRTASDAFVAKLPKTDIVYEDYDIPVPAKSEGIVINSSVNYNLVYATYKEMNMEGYNGKLDAICALVSDGLLYPLLRDQYGAYGVFHGADDSGMYIISYRDPNVTETFEVYAAIPQLLTQLQMMLDQDTLDGYILSCYSYYALSSGELTGAVSVISDVINGDDPFIRLQWMHELKQMTVEDISTFADMYQALLDNGCMSTAASQSTLDSMPEGTYDAIIKP